eukprot:m.610918 g.610918  ORF g.610918 m.610918 type:complete len:76 (+) comp22495_c0_seq21:1711-1938(+)
MRDSCASFFTRRVTDALPMFFADQFLDFSAPKEIGQMHVRIVYFEQRKCRKTNFHNLDHINTAADQIVAFATRIF